MFAATHMLLTPQSSAPPSTVIPYTIPFLIPATPGAHYTDDFNRADSASLGSDWVTDVGNGASLIISSNAALADVSLFVGANFYRLPMVTGDNQITAVMKGTPAAGDLVAITARSDSGTDSTAATKFVQASMEQGGLWTLYRYAAGSGVSTAGNESWADGDTIALTAVGATLTIKRNGSTVLTTGGATDLTAGYVQLIAASFSGANFGFDSFDAQDI